MRYLCGEGGLPMRLHYPMRRLRQLLSYAQKGNKLRILLFSLRFLPLYAELVSRFPSPHRKDKRLLKKYQEDL